MRFKHLAKQFRNEHKVFLLSVTNGGQSIEVLERNRVHDFHVSFDLREINWFFNTVKEVVGYGGKHFFFSENLREAIIFYS